MKQRLPFIILAVLCVLGAIWATHSYVRDQERKIAKALQARYEREYGPAKGLLADTKEVIVATRDLRPGQVVAAENLEIKTIPAAYTQPYALRSEREAIGMEAVVRIASGEQLMSTKLRRPGQGLLGGSMAGRTPVGRRAVTFRAEELGLLELFVQPGDFVDLLWTTAVPLPDGTTSPVTVTLLQHIQVLHVTTGVTTGSDNQPDGGGLRTVTLALTPEAAELLLLARAQGGQNSWIHLSIRPPTDTEQLALQPATGQTLLGIIFPQLVAAAAQPPPPRRVEVFRGQEKSVIEVPAAQ